MTKYKTDAEAVADINKLLRKAMVCFEPMPDLNLVEWAEQNRILPATSPEPGPWRTERTPYLKEPMLAMTDPLVKQITNVAGGQVGKSELLLNALGRIADIAPGTTLFTLPTLDVARRFSKDRISPLFEDTECLKSKNRKTVRKLNSSMLYKSFPGGQVTICGSESASALCSTPFKYFLGDEIDRWAYEAGEEGDPIQLIITRQSNFFDSLAILSSTPTIKGKSRIVKSFMKGTQEYYYTQCPHCREWILIKFEHIKFEYEKIKSNGEIRYTHKLIGFECPKCKKISSEDTIRKQPCKWIAQNPDAYNKGHRSFWYNPFFSSWRSWDTIIERFLETKDDPIQFKVFVNTVLGELWEEKNEMTSEENLLDGREEYDAELPEGVVCLTCGVDTQDTYLQYEIVGHGLYGEEWGIQKGLLSGEPSQDYTWTQLDKLLDKTWTFKDGIGLKIGFTFVDSGGHFTSDVYKQCAKRFYKRVFPIKGKGGEDIPFINQKPTKIYINAQKTEYTFLYTLGVDEGKVAIMNALKRKSGEDGFFHFPKNPELGYDYDFFRSLLSESYVYEKGKWRWVILPGHKRNEALDCRNYARGAFKVWNPNMSEIIKRISEKRQNISRPQKSGRKFTQAKIW